MGIGLTSGGTWAYSSTCSAVRVSRDVHARGGRFIGCVLVPPHIQIHTSITRGRGHKEGLNGTSCLLCYSIPIRFEARSDPSGEFPDVPMGPLPERSYPGVD